MNKSYPASLHQYYDWKSNQARLRNGYPPSLMLFQEKLDSDISVNHIKTACELIFRKYDILRTSFSMIEEAVIQNVHEYEDEKFKMIEYSPTTNHQTVFDHLNQRLSLNNNGPAASVVLINNNQDGFLFVFALHHIISDVITLNTISLELENLYDVLSKGESPSLGPAPIQYADYINLIQKEEGENHERSLSFWKNKLATKNWHLDYYKMYAYLGCKNTSEESPAGNVNNFSLDDILNNQKGTTYQTILNISVVEKIKHFQLQHNVNTFLVLLGMFNILAYKLFRSKEVLIQSIYSNRSNLTSENILGNFLGMLLTHNEIDESLTFTEFMFNCCESIGQSIANVLYDSHPLETLSLTTHTFLMLNFIASERQIIKEYFPQATPIQYVNSHCPLYCVINEYENAIVLDWEYNSSFYDETAMRSVEKVLLAIIDRFLEGSDKRIVEFIRE